MESQDDRLMQVLDNLPGLVAILDQQLCYRFANRQHVNWLGENPESIAGLHVADIFGEPAYEELQPMLASARAGRSANYSGEVSLPGRGDRFVQAVCAPLETGDGTDILFALTDFSELRQTQRALDSSTQRSHTILETAVDAVITIDRAGLIRSCNGATTTMFGYSNAEMLGQNVKLLMPQAYAEAHDGYLQRYLETGERHIIGIGRDVTARHKDGTEFPAHLAVGEFADRGRRYFTGFIRDMSEQKKAEQQARHHLEELAHLSRLSAVESLTSTITHEVNQPLTAIVTMSQALLRMQRSGRGDPAMLEDVLERIVNQSIRVNTIIRQMRELARKAKSTERSPAVLREVIAEAMLLLSPELEASSINLEQAYEANSCVVTINRIQIEQVVLNLVQNAIQAIGKDRKDGRVRISTELVEDGAHVQVSVSDNGPGLPEIDSGDVFTPFFTTREQGMGQGLSISRSIVESHGGKISASNRPDGGAIFYFTLPTAVEHPDE